MLTMNSVKRTIWLHPEDKGIVQIVDQRKLPHQLVIEDLSSSDQAATAIREMWVRGAPLIGATAAYGVYLATREAKKQEQPEAYLKEAMDKLALTRPTAVNLQWALDRQAVLLQQTQLENWEAVSLAEAKAIVEEDVEICRMIGVHGLDLIKAISKQKGGEPVNVLTHCNAGRMACIEWGTATSPVYQAHALGIPVHVWVDETRPRNQGARLTAWELNDAGIPHTVIVDNVGGHLMQHGMVDICFVGTDRTTRTGDVANKIGTYLKALAAHDNEVPFYVALPSSTIDWTLRDGLKEIPIEERGGREVTHIYGQSEAGQQPDWVQLTPNGSPAINFGFDVTPAKYVTGLITERGICEASEKGLTGLFPEEEA